MKKRIYFFVFILLNTSVIMIYGIDNDILTRNSNSCEKNYFTNLKLSVCKYDSFGTYIYDLKLEKLSNIDIIQNISINFLTKSQFADIKTYDLLINNRSEFISHEDSNSLTDPLLFTISISKNELNNIHPSLKFQVNILIFYIDNSIESDHFLYLNKIANPYLYLDLIFILNVIVFIFISLIWILDKQFRLFRPHINIFTLINKNLLNRKGFYKNYLNAQTLIAKWSNTSVNSILNSLTFIRKHSSDVFIISGLMGLIIVLISPFKYIFTEFSNVLSSIDQFTFIISIIIIGFFVFMSLFLYFGKERLNLGIEYLHESSKEIVSKSSEKLLSKKIKNFNSKSFFFPKSQSNYIVYTPGLLSQLNKKLHPLKIVEQECKQQLTTIAEEITKLEKNYSPLVERQEDLIRLNRLEKLFEKILEEILAIPLKSVKNNAVKKLIRKIRKNYQNQEQWFFYQIFNYKALITYVYFIDKSLKLWKGHDEHFFYQNYDLFNFSDYRVELINEIINFVEKQIAIILKISKQNRIHNRVGKILIIISERQMRLKKLNINKKLFENKYNEQLEVIKEIEDQIRQIKVSLGSTSAGSKSPKRLEYLALAKKQLEILSRHPIKNKRIIDHIKFDINFFERYSLNRG